VRVAAVGEMETLMAFDAIVTLAVPNIDESRLLVAVTVTEAVPVTVEGAVYDPF